MIGVTIGAMVGGTGAAMAISVGIEDDFVREVEGLLKPGTSAIFVLDDEGDMDVILHSIRGLGGTVLKTKLSHTNVHNAASRCSRLQHVPCVFAAAPATPC